MKNLLFAALAALVVFGATGCSKDPVLASSAMVTRVELRDFPAFDPTGFPWDEFSSWPDIYFLLEPGTTVNGDYYESNYVDECFAGSVVYWNNLSVLMNNLSNNWAFGFYDYDTAGSDSYMGSFNFRVTAAERESQPNYIDRTVGDFSVRIYLTWFE
jgi:hypothetical protein